MKISRPTKVTITHMNAGERIEQPAEPQRAGAEVEPGEVVDECAAGFASAA